MSYDLCLPMQAKRPYYIEAIRTGIWSLEELCFYLYNNACLIDESIINEKLCDWIRDELGLTKLYRQLYEQLDKKEGAAFFVLPVFREAGYLTPQEMRDYQEKLGRLEVQSEEMKQKLRGDYLVKERMFARAIWEYRQILKKKNPGKLGVQFYAGVWNNLGAAYAGLYQFSQAADCFWESYGLMKTKETLRKYISALPLFLSDEEYQRRIKSIGVDADLASNIQEYNAKICEGREFQEKLARTVAQDAGEVDAYLKEEYGRSARL